VSDAGPVYDPVELRRRIVVCFSVGELRALAESLGVGGIAWDRGINEAAREVVRQSERYAGLPALVARLREIRPLVEWPDAAPSVAADAPSPAGPPPALSSPGSLGPPMTAPQPGPRAAPSSPPLHDPYAAQPGPPAIQVPVPPPSQAPPASGVWPGVTEEPAAAPAQGIDPRIFIVVAGLMVVAAIIAYLAGRASGPATAAGASPAANASAAAPGAAKSDGPAALAAGMLAQSFAELARVCELPSSAGGSELVFHRVYERCGPGAPARRPYSPPSAAGASASAEPAPSAEPAAPRNRRTGRGGDAPPGEAPSPSKGCVGACEAVHSACSGRCGPEPTESTAYDTFQRCQGRCLSEASRCRLNCH
jgi:hypothetical protein